MISKQCRSLLLPLISLLSSHSTNVVFLLWDLYILKFSQLPFLFISNSGDCYIYQHACPLFSILDYNVWLVVRDGSVCLYLLIPQYVYIIIIIIIIIILAIAASINIVFSKFCHHASHCRIFCYKEFIPPPIFIFSRNMVCNKWYRSSV